MNPSPADRRTVEASAGTAPSVALEMSAGASKSRPRLPISYRGIAQAAMVTDVVIICAASVAGQWLSSAFRPNLPIDASRDLAAAVFVAVLFVTSQRIRDLYEPMQLLNRRLQFRSVVGAWFGAFLILASGLFTWRIGDAVSRTDLVLFGSIGALALLAHRIAWQFILPGALNTGGLRRRQAALIACDNLPGDVVAASLRAYGNTVAFQKTLRRSSRGEEFETEIDGLIASVRGQEIEEIFIAADLEDVSTLKEIGRKLRVLPQPVTLLPLGALRDLIQRTRVDLGSLIALELQRAPLSSADLAAKRFVDLTIALCGLIVLSPLLLITALMIRLDSPGPTLFRQTRHGFNGRAFQIYKFRTMRVLENGAAIRQATANDPRVTKVGRWLRRYSIDELPQLLNVLAGDMSIVGPRPHASAHDQHFSEILDTYAFRHHVKAGLTGWAQIQGARGETDTPEKMQRRVDLDIWYISNWSLWLDFYIMLRTAIVVLKAENAH